MTAVGDTDRLSQVFMNLLSNAVHYNREQGEIRISTGLENGTAVVRVADTGQGIPSEDVPRVFERFYRGDRARSRAERRQGLGLAIAKAVVDAHGGSIEVSSQPGVGSVFTVRLPGAA
ncbi:MAG: cell wall metabolism sensor histidine kinase WalK [Verrucomicrobia bacterium]|nr:cell wall metabolism sensor histidine kinase WalK [Verrucomicrobiota bacterium]